MSETHGITMAKASEQELEALLDFIHSVEEQVEDGEDETDLGEWLIEYVQKHNGLPFSVDRIVFGYRTMLESACDPNLSYLDFKPEIKSALFHQAAKSSDGNQ